MCWWGKVVHKGRDEIRGTTGTYISLADSILEYAVPDTGTEAHADWATGEPDDTYHSITWKVANLDAPRSTSRRKGCDFRCDRTTRRHRPRHESRDSVGIHDQTDARRPAKKE